MFSGGVLALVYALQRVFNWVDVSDEPVCWNLREARQQSRLLASALP